MSIMTDFWIGGVLALMIFAVIYATSWLWALWDPTDRKYAKDPHTWLGLTLVMGVTSIAVTVFCAFMTVIGLGEWVLSPMVGLGALVAYALLFAPLAYGLVKRRRALQTG